MGAPPAGMAPSGSRLTKARDQARRAGDWASVHVPGGYAAAAAFERQRLEAAGLIAGGLAYRLFFWLVPLGLVLAAVLSFWIDEDRVAVADAAHDFGMGAAATRAAMDAIAQESYPRWYLLVAGVVLLIWFSMGVVRALVIAHSLAWKIRPERVRRPLAAGLLFTVVFLCLITISGATQFLRESLGGTGIGLTLVLVLLYSAAAIWALDKLPSRAASWRDHVPGAVLLAVGVQLLHLFVVLYLAPKIGRSSQLYGSLGAATVILLWLYLMARLVVAAAFLNAALWERRVAGAET